MQLLLCFYIAICICISIRGEELNYKTFPKGFIFGTATSAYQIEGGWNKSGKGENIWDHFTHQHPENIVNHSNGDIACDSYNKLEEDVLILKSLGVDFYRFSLAWSRILPKGFAYHINKDGIRYYNKLIDLLIANKIMPMVTIFHWDTPQPIEEMGGFTSALMVDWFEEYARVAFEHFGDRVKYWTTFNEPLEICQRGYGGVINAPGYNFSGVADYMCAHNLLKSHAKVYHLYNNTFKATQKGRIGITLNGPWYEPATDSNSDIEAAQRAMEFTFGWFADPIFHPNGDYPRSMKELIEKRSIAEGFPKSRLPKFTKAEVNFIKGTYDYFGVNHYTTKLTSDVEVIPIGDPSYEKDMRVELEADSDWPVSPSSWLKVVPWGFRRHLNWIKDRYGNPEVIVTENGYADLGELDDQDRVNYHKLYLSSLLDAIYKDDVKVTGYAVWSLLDNFEWTDGYLYKFGLYHVDFSDPNRPRTPKSSAQFYKRFLAKRRLTSSSATKLAYLSVVFLLIISNFISWIS